LILSTLRNPTQLPHDLRCSRSHICVVERRAFIQNLGANVITVPIATAIPEMLSTNDQVWLKATGLAASDAVSITLTAPEGTTCVLGPTSVTAFNGGVQAFTVPGDCAQAGGTWTATFNDGSADVAAARFLVVQAPPTQPSP